MPVPAATIQTRIREHNTAFSKRRRRLGLSVKNTARWLRTPYTTVKNWNQGLAEPPRTAMRLLALYRLDRWGNY
ncbi:MAG: hypothetical protein OEZ43_20920 [Gammaproteobacteria bacterium]|nr:hypothetical protein [Gammaproteobacteria bacterium]